MSWPAETDAAICSETWHGELTVTRGPQESCRLDWEEMHDELDA